MSYGTWKGPIGWQWSRSRSWYIVFSLDSVITAVGLVEEVSVTAIAIILAVVVMLIAAKSIGTFVDDIQRSKFSPCRF